MEFTIKNESLKVVINDKGAELQSIQTADGTLYRGTFCRSVGL